MGSHPGGRVALIWRRGNLVHVVRREEAPVVTPADNGKTLRCLNAVKRAAETGQIMELA